MVADNEGMFSCLFDVPGDKQLQEAIYVQIRSKENYSNSRFNGFFLFICFDSQLFIMILEVS